MNVKSILKSSQEIDLLDVQVLLAHVLKMSRADLYAFDDRELNQQEYEIFTNLISRRLKGEPIAYLVGEKEFYGMSFIVSPDVLIPRPDTECLIETVLLLVSQPPALHSLGEKLLAPFEGGSRVFRGGGCFSILDLCTGSGIIACVLSAQNPHIKILATDISQPALNIAQQNINRHAFKNITLRQSNLFQNIPETFDLIVSNPPYINKNDPHLLTDIRFEPEQALVADDNGLAILHQIIKHAKSHLNPDGYLCVEHGFDQGKDIRQLFQQYGFKNINTMKDLSGNERVTSGRH